MSFIENIVVVGGIVGFFFAFGLGANEAANALGTIVGTKTLSLRKAVVFGSIFEFSGAVLMGKLVSSTIATKIVNPDDFADDYVVFMIGMFSAMTAASLWMFFVTFFKLPVSSTHCIIGAVAGFGVASRGFRSIKYLQLIYIVISWVVSPIVGGVISFSLVVFINRHIFSTPRPNQMSIKLTPYFAAATVAVVCMIVLVALTSWRAWVIILVVIGIFIATTFISKLLLGLTFSYIPSQNLLSEQDSSSPQNPINALELTNPKDPPPGETTPQPSESEVTAEASAAGIGIGVAPPSAEQQHKLEVQWSQDRFKYLLFISSAVLAFAHGGNDVANAVGPFSVIFEYHKNGDLDNLDEWSRISVLLVGGAGISLGVILLGHKVIETVGSKITRLDPSSGFCAQFATAITVNFASLLALPVSSTSVLVGAIAGVGLSKKEDNALDRKLMLKIFCGWALTVAVGFVTSAVIFEIVLAIYDK